MADIALSEAATTLTPVGPRDVAEEANSATLVSPSRRNQKNMSSRVRRVRGSSRRIGRDRSNREAGQTVSEEKPLYTDYLAEQRARRLQRLRSKNKSDSRNELRRQGKNVIDEEADNLRARNNTSEDSGRGVSAGSSGSKDEGIHSTGEKDEELDAPEDKDSSVTAEKDEDDEGHGSINGEAEADDEASDQETQEVEGQEVQPLDDNGYVGDMDEPNSLAASFKGPLDVSSDAGLGTTYDLSSLRNNLNEIFHTGQKEGEDGGEEKAEEKAAGDEAESAKEDEVGEATEDLAEADPETDGVEEKNDGEESGETVADPTLEPEKDAEAEPEVEPEAESENDVKSDAVAEVEADTMPDVETDATVETEPKPDEEADVTTETVAEPESTVETEGGTEAETEPEAIVETEGGTEAEAEPESSVETEGGTEAEANPEATVETEGGTEAEVEPGAEAETEAASESEKETKSEAEQEKELEAEAETETEADAEADKGTDPSVELEMEAEAEPGVEAEAETESETQADAEPEPEAETETISEAERETETEAETEKEAETEAAEAEVDTSIEAEADTEAKVEAEDNADSVDTEAAEDETKVKEDDGTEPVETPEEQEDSSDKAEVEPDEGDGDTADVQDEPKEDGEVELKTEDATEASATTDNKEEDQEEEIQEVPSIAKLPVRFRRKNAQSKVDHVQKNLPPRRTFDMNKVKSKRKPISIRSGPIQTSRRPEVNKPTILRRPRRAFKAKPIPKPEPETNAEDVIKETEEPPEDTESQVSQETNRSSTAGSEPQDMPPVTISKLGDNELLGALETDRSIRKIPEEDSNFQDISRPETAGKTYRKEFFNKAAEDKTPRGSIASQGKKSGGTSEVWVPEENKLYVYTYSSQPRLLHVRRVGARVATTDKYDNDPNSSFRLKIRGNGNPMYDRRVVRGSNYAKRMSGDDLPKWNPYFSNARSLSPTHSDPANADMSQSMKLRRQEFRQKLEARARLRRENHGISSLYPSGSQGYRNFARQHVHVQTENYYEPLERPPEAETGVQTDTWTEDGGFVVPVVEPTVTGVDITTQVYDTELDAETDDDALVAVLVGQTIREAVLEVAHEEQAEQARINSLAADSISSFLKPEETSAEEDKSKEGDEEEPAAPEEREEPEGKEQTPDEEEPPRTEEISSPDPKEEAKVVTEGEDNQPAEVEA